MVTYQQGWLSVLLRKLVIIASILPLSALATNEAYMATVPQGPGGIDGLGEKFSVEANAGTSYHRTAISVPSGRAGLTPDLALEYSSGYGNGILGMGMRLTVPYIQRQTEKGLPTYEDWQSMDRRDSDADGEIDEYEEADTYIDQEGRELVYVGNNRYRLQQEGDFILYEKLNSGWLVYQPNGQRLYFGTVSNSRIEDGAAGHIYRWMLEKVVDLNGNEIRYAYEAKDNSAMRYLQNISWSHKGVNSVGVRLFYEKRPDILTDYRPGFELKLGYRLSELVTYAGSTDAIRYDLTYYPESELQTTSLLHGVQKMSANGADKLPAQIYTWTTINTAEPLTHVFPNAARIPFDDVNGRFWDINNDGLQDFISNSLDYNTYWYNLGADAAGQVQFSRRMRIVEPSTTRFTDKNIAIADIDGDAVKDMLVFNGSTVKPKGLRVLDEEPGSEVTPEVTWKWIEKDNRIPLNYADRNTRFVDINNDKRVDALFLTGARHRVSLNYEDGWSAPLDLPKPRSWPLLSFSDPSVMVADMNGDRLLDIVKVSVSSYQFNVEYYPGRGLAGFGERIRYQPVNRRGVRLEDVELADINGDGRADFVYTNRDSANVWLNKGVSATARGELSVFGDVVTLASPLGRNVSPGHKLVDLNGNGSLDFVWYDARSSVSEIGLIDLAAEAQPYQLASVDNGLGKTLSFEYTSTTEEMLRDRASGYHWSKRLPFGMSVVSAVSVKDAISGTEEKTRYSYRDGIYHVEEKTFWGFMQSTATAEGESVKSTLVTRTDYLPGVEQRALKGKVHVQERKDGNDTLFDRTWNTWESVLVAEPVVEESRQIEMAQLTSVTTEILEGESSAIAPVILKTDYDYDDFGNLITVSEWGRTDTAGTPGFGDDERVRRVTYSANYKEARDNWILSLPVEEAIEDENGILASKVQHYYDDESFSGNNLGSVEKGNLTMSVAWVNPAQNNDRKVAVTRRKYNDEGNVTDIYDPLWTDGKAGHKQHLDYDPVFGTYVTDKTTATGNTELTEHYDVDVRFGVAIAYTDANQQQTTFGYDGLGRVTQIVKPGDSTELPTQSFDYLLAQKTDNGLVNTVISYQREVAGEPGTVEVYQHFDGRGRTLQTISEDETAGSYIVSDSKQYDLRGQLKTQWLAYKTTTTRYQASPAAGDHLSYSYDALNRPVQALQPIIDGALVAEEIHTTYGPLTQIVQDEEQSRSGSIHSGSRKILRFDGLKEENGEHRLVSLTDEVKVAANGEITGSVQPYTTTYKYDLQNNLIEVKDAAGHIKNLYLDGLGRQYAANDPDRGDTYHVFDDAGNLVRQRDARGQEIVREYDGINRLIAEYAVNARNNQGNGLNPGDVWLPDTVAPQGGDELLVHYSYDVSPGNISDKAPTNLRGRLAAVTSEAGFEQWSYDARGRIGTRLYKPALPASVAATVPESFVNTYIHDSADRLRKQVWSDGTELIRGYNSRGLLEQVNGVISHIDYAAHGGVKQFAYNNGVNVEHRYDARNRLQSVTSQRLLDMTQLQAMVYHYDGVSNITRIEDQRTDMDMAMLGAELNLTVEQQQTFREDLTLGYDDYYRLTGADNANTVGELEYRYDLLGNLLSRNGNILPAHNVADEPLKPESYLYGAAGNPEEKRPNLLTRRADSIYRYDASGLLTEDGDYRYQWDARQRLSESTPIQLLAAPTSHYRYDQSGVRRIKYTTAPSGKIDADSVIVYVGNDSEWRNGKLYKYAQVLGERVALSTRSASATSATNGATKNYEPEQYYLVHHNQSNALTLDKAGLVVDAIAYYPYGQARAQASVLGQDEPQIPYRYANKEKDRETGLQYFEQRYLSNRIGRFITPDPVYATAQRLINPQYFNPYAYANNNPFRFVDPDGRASQSLDHIPMGKTQENVIVDSWQSSGGSDRDMEVWASYYIEKDKNTLTIVAHGTSFSIGGKELDAWMKIVVPKVNDSNGKIKNIKILSCNTGKFENGIGKRFADALKEKGVNVNVSAAIGTVKPEIKTIMKDRLGVNGEIIYSSVAGYKSEYVIKDDDGNVLDDGMRKF